MQAEAIDSALIKELNNLMDQLAQDGLAISEQLFPLELCQQLRQELKNLVEQESLHKASIGHAQSKQIQNSIRGDFIHWLPEIDKIDSSEPSSAWKATSQRLQTLQQILNEQLFLGVHRFESHFAFYPPGAGYQKHFDNHLGHNSRKITFILYLNDWMPKNKGELIIFSEKNPELVLKKVEPRIGTFVLFRSEVFPHEVVASCENRYSLTGWYRTDR